MEDYSYTLPLILLDLKQEKLLRYFTLFLFLNFPYISLELPNLIFHIHFMAIDYFNLFTVIITTNFATKIIIIIVKIMMRFI